MVKKWENQTFVQIYIDRLRMVYANMNSPIILNKRKLMFQQSRPVSMPRPTQSNRSLTQTPRLVVSSSIPTRSGTFSTEAGVMIKQMSISFRFWKSAIAV